MKLLMIAVLAALLVPLGYWIGGYDFDVRGAEAFMCYLLSIYVGAATYVLGRIWA